MKTFFSSLCCVVWFSLVPHALADNETPYFARTWLAEDGLPDNRVVGLAQTPDGYLWVATQGGTVRFDGVRFQRVSIASSPSLIAGTMRALLLDREGRVWLAKDEGGTVFCFDGAQVRMLSADQGLPKNETQRSLAMDGKGDLWVTYSSGKVIRCARDGKVDTFTSKDGLPGDGGICWLATGHDGTLWFAKGSHLGVFRNGRFNVLENFGSPALRIAPAHAGGIWVCVGQQVLKFDEGVETVELGKIIPDQTGGPASFEPSVLFEDREGAVWVGTVSAGLFRCDSNAVTRVEVSNPAILSLAGDREGNLWVGTRGGLNRVHRRLTSMIGPADGLPFQGVQSVCQDAAGSLWLVGENGVLVRGQGTNWPVQSSAGGLAKTYVTCAVADTNGSVWIGGRRGALFRWSGGEFKDLGLRTNLQERAVRSLLVTRTGDLWIGTDLPDVLYRLRGEKLQSFNLPTGYRFIRAMAEDTAGNVWAGASDGLLVRVTGDDLVDETAKSAAWSIRCLHGAANGDLWIGYAGAGAGRLRNGTITRFGIDEGLPNDYVAQILTDGRGSVWFAGNQGIYQVHERNFDDLANGSATRLWPVVYGRSEGLPGLQASFDYCPDSLRSSDDRLYFSMLSGLAEVRLDFARLNYRQPDVFIERVIADDRANAVYQDLKLASPTNGTASMREGKPADKGELRLPPGLQQVQFEFTALSFVAPENVQFRYQLEGLDKDWVDAGTRRVASYTHPPPGHYHFKVVACNNDGIWNKVGDTLAVDFEPYFWETLWFKVVTTAVSFASLFVVLVLVLRRRHRLVVERLEHQRALELERNRIARDLHDDLGVGLTEIGLLGDLAGTNHELPSADRERLSEITGRARTLAASLDEIVWAINPANDTSQSLVDYFFPYAQKLLGSAGIRCRLEVIEPLPAGNLNAEGRHEFFHAYKEALNNIIRHSGATQVQVTMSAAEGNLVIRIADNGRGLAEGAGRGAHHGLAGMRERLLRLGGRCDLTSHAGQGTEVTFIIPVQPEK
ncbi:MAG TPA: two-component regulator propeller domain-containing protein [Candidatus Acidoferrales bacterium]|nr:two-component regulator propeller domain-containing protein [Candidatus Acidoferrales bacterium]